MSAKPFSVYLLQALLVVTLVVLAWLLRRCWQPRNRAVSVVWTIVSIALAILCWPVALHFDPSLATAIVLLCGVCAVLAMVPAYFEIWHGRRRAESSAKPRRPTFVWQAVLILLPTCILAGFGFAAMLRDRAMVEEDARRKAKELVQSLAGGVGLSFGQQIAPGFNGLAEGSALRGWCGDELLPTPRDRSGNPRELSDEERALLTEVRERTTTTWPAMQKRGSVTATFVLGDSGTLEWPVPYDAAPLPATWPAELSAEQTHAWRVLQSADCAGTNATEIKRLTDAFLATSPGAAARANAELMQLRANIPAMRPVDAANALLALARPNHALSEAGLPLSHLAFAEALRLGSTGYGGRYFWNTLQLELSEHPSVLAARLVELAEQAQAKRPYARLEVAELRRRWQQDEMSRDLANRLAASGLVTPLTMTNLWFDAPQGRCLCLIYPAPQGNGDNSTSVESSGGTRLSNGTIVRVFPRYIVERLIQTYPWNVTWPSYFGVSCEVEGGVFGAVLGGDNFNTILRQQPPISRRDHGITGEVLAEARGEIGMAKELLNRSPIFAEFEMPSHPRYALRVHLADRTALFAQQRQRAMWFGALILGSVVASCTGLVAAHRAFRRQLQLNEAKSNFVSSVSHELRAPIASVRLLAESLERGKVGEAGKQREYFGFIVQECRRLSSLIENVLDFSRIEQGRKQYDFEPTDLGTLATQTVKLMEPYATEKGVRLELGTSNIQHRTSSIGLGNNAAAEPSNLEPRISSFEIMADGKALQQALVNLIDNAIKHSPKGETVKVGLDGLQSSAGVPPAPGKGETGLNKSNPTLEPRAGGTPALLWVEDHGKGIPPEEHERIFERFYRRGSELRRETQGVGIGLSIVKHIVEAHGGRVLVRSAVGQGCRFTIELPAKRNHQ